MIAWQIIILLFMFYYFNKNGFNKGIFVTVLLQSIYIGKFFFWETGYFNTLDITLDRAGYYICWGCLVFLPSLYTFSTYYLINQKGDISKKVAIFILLNVGPLNAILLKFIPFLGDGLGNMVFKGTLFKALLAGILYVVIDNVLPF